MEAQNEAVLSQDPNNQDLIDVLRQLGKEQKTLVDMWKKKNVELYAALGLQIFLKEVDQIDSVIASYEAMRS